MARYVIVGSGAAGIGAVEGIRGLDRHGEIVLISEEDAGYYSRPGLAYLLTGEITEPFLFPFREQDFTQLDVQQLCARVVRLWVAERQMELESGQRIPYEQLLLAMGAQAARLQMTGIEAQGVVKLDCLDDAHQIIKMARKAHSAVVVGGGITALEIVEGLISNRMKVHYFLRGDRYWNNVLDETESRIIEHRLQEEGVQIHFHTELAEILQKKGKLSGVRTQDGQTIFCEILAVAVGVKPRISLAQQAGLHIDRGVVVDEFLQTSAAGVFAAGDVAQVFDPLTGRHVLDSLWGPARHQGTTAGRNMAAQLNGQPLEPYNKKAAFNVTRLANLTTTIIGTVGNGIDADLVGIARGDSEVWRQLPDAIAAQSGFDVNRLRLMIGKETLLGAVIMGDQTLSRPLQHIIAEQIDITSIYGDLLRSDECLADVIADFWCNYKQ